jgi:hypothetical protein
MHRRIAVFCASAAAFGCLAFAGSASAGQPTSFSGVVSNGGCDTPRTVPVSGPSRIEVHVSSTSAANSVYAEIVSPSGAVVATGKYDTPSGGNYGISVCSYYDEQNSPYIQWTGIYGTGPAGQPALPQQQGGVLGVTATISHDVHGTGAFKTPLGLAHFTLSLDQNGLGIVKVFDPVLKKNLLFTRTNVTFGTNTIRMTKGHMTLTLIKRGSAYRIVFHSPRFAVSGKMVHARFIIV